jgi:MoCo/4Fe-4S cofactor protein with predicted Tat translocation signal
MKHHVTNQNYWQSLEQYADGPEIREQIEKEFPGYNPDVLLNLSRRSFMRLMSASLAFAGVGLAGCRRWPQEKLAPYTVNPKNRLPGVPEQYASIMELGGVARPLLVTSFDGRPIKIEGNPSHPFSWTVPNKIGSADAMAQASVLELYDPDRSREVVDRTVDPPAVSTWEAFRAVFDPQMAKLRGTGGQGLAVLSETSTSPTVERLKAKFLTTFPSAKWYEYEPISNDNELAGTKLAFGGPFRVWLKLENAVTLVSFDADLLGTHPAHTRYAADWAARRRSVDQGDMNRVYIAESCLSITGSVADERLATRPSRMGALLSALAAKLDAGGAALTLSAEETAWVESAAADLLQNKGASAVAIGGHLPPELHHLGHAINHQLGAFGSVVTLTDAPGGDRPSHLDSIIALGEDIKAKNVSTLLILGGNPVYDAPADLDFTRRIDSVPFTIRLGLYEDETSLHCKWHLPRAHFLECWGDGRSWDGTISVQQPMIEPLYDGKSLIEFLALTIGIKLNDGDSLVRGTFATLLSASDFEKNYRRVLHDGLLPDSAPQPRTPSFMPPTSAPAASSATGLEVRYQQSLGVYDGRFANSGWLQEMPDPLTKVTWDNPALISKKDCDDLGVVSGDSMPGA